MSFAGFTRRSANVDFTQKLKNDSGVVLKPCKRYLKGRGNSAFKCKPFSGSTTSS